MAVPGESGSYFINPFGFHFGEIRASDLLKVDAAGTVIEGNHAIEATAFTIHSRIHRARPDASCVLHTHMPYATALTAIEGGKLEFCHQNSLRFFGRVGYDESFGGYNGLALDDAEGDRIVDALGSNQVLFLENHGVIVVGPSLAEAFDALYYLERAAQIQVLGMSTGRPLKHINTEIAIRTAATFARDAAEYADVHLQALKRLLDRDDPTWRD
jgi:ribulose-5-phosphate 4-epimerase/fuculose-1-phosphate aldolase